MTAIEEPDAPAVDPDAVEITINGRAVAARKGELVIAAADRAGEYIPRFCYHERMNPVGMCRMCIVDIDTGRGPQLQPSCMVPVAPGMKVGTESAQVKRVQEGIIELLLANHPLDCPVCDKGGECPLQDQAFSHGPGESRYIEEKRHFAKPIPISELVYLDRERCILCDRCTRFADEVAGDPLIHFISRGNDTQVMTFPDEPFTSYFSGNTVQICPVGALTAKPFRFKARPWDLRETESTCTTCAVGCRVVVQSSRDQLVRFQGVDSDPVNWGWLCDRGRFGFETVNSPERLEHPMVRSDGSLAMSTWNAALEAAARAIGDAVAAGGPAGVAVLGGARGTNEDAFAWARLAHDVVGTPHVAAQLADGLPVGVLGMPRATIEEVCSSGTVVLLGPDLKEELPVLYLRLRDAAVNRGTRLVEIAARDSGLTRYAWRTVGYEPGRQASGVRAALADEQIRSQLDSGTVTIVVGRANLAEPSSNTVAALRVLQERYPRAKILPALRRGNVVGAVQLGLRPGRGGLDSTGILNAAAAGKVGCLVLLGCDPLTDFPDADLAARAVAGAGRVISVDTFATSSTQLADVVLPAAAFGEKGGTTTNIEGRVTTLGQRVTARGTSRPDWMIATEIALLLGEDLGFGSVDDVTTAISETVDAYGGVTLAALAASSDGVLAGVPAAIDPPNPGGDEAPERNSYDFRLMVSRRLYDTATATMMAASLAPLVGSTAVHLHPLDLERIGAHEGSDVRVISVRTSTVLPVVADPAVHRGVAWVPYHQLGTSIGPLVDSGTAATDVRIESV
jgi:NADH-quinone oxidoreductase subunit G